jgi:creatinine amidohydrolase
MRWNEMTAPEFAEAVKSTEGVCLLPLGVMEKHGEHLPVGIDYMKGWHYADMASIKEKAVVFPPYYIGSISGAKHCPGTFALPGPLLDEVLEATCAEISRNGLKKIILVNSHGGNQSWLHNFIRNRLDSEHDYMVYLCPLHFGPMTEKAIADLKEKTRDFGGHGGSYETAVALHLFPELVKMDEILSPENGRKLNRLKELDEYAVKTPVAWYSNHPEHIAGYGGEATQKDGEEICAAIVDDLSEIIRRVKADDVSMELYKEFLAESISH